MMNYYLKKKSLAIPELNRGKQLSMEVERMAMLKASRCRTNIAAAYNLLVPFVITLKTVYTTPFMYPSDNADLKPLLASSRQSCATLSSDWLILSAKA